MFFYLKPFLTKEELSSFVTLQELVSQKKEIIREIKKLKGIKDSHYYSSLWLCKLEIVVNTFVNLESKTKKVEELKIELSDNFSSLSENFLNDKGETFVCMLQKKKKKMR